MPPETLEELLTATRSAIERIPRHEPEFTFEFAFADDYEHLLSQDLEPPTLTVDKILNRTFEHGRAVLAAEAGAGKSTLMLRLLTRAIELGHAVVRVDLRRWTPAVNDKWKNVSDGPGRRMDVLFTCLTDVPISERKLRRLARGVKVLIAVDGLNEVPPSTTIPLLFVLDDFASRRPSAGVVVCDRLLRRELPSEQWQMAKITRVNPPRGLSSPPRDNALLLDVAHNGSTTAEGEAAILLDHLVTQAQLDPGELTDLADACFDVYRHYGDGEGRFFPLQDFRTRLDADVVDRLLGSGELLREADRAYFRHHLFHDSLAARALVGHHEWWTWQGFDALSFEANSFDAVALALELASNPADADALVSAIYDWNLYAAAYAVSQARRRGSSRVSRSTEIALLAVLAERRWDPVASSAERVEDALRVWRSEFATQLLNAADIDEVVSLVRNEVAGETRADWLRIFSGEATSEELVAALSSGPIAGWMASNALRRQPLDEPTRQAILRSLRSPDGTVRWRSAHTLGSDSSDQAVYGLLSVLDEDAWVWARYGAIRALIEIAAHDETRRRLVLDELDQRLERLEKDPKVFLELQRALELRDPPVGWAGEVGPLIEGLFMRASTVADQDHWRRVGWRVTESVRSARKRVTR